MKRILSILLVIVMILSLSACGKPTENDVVTKSPGDPNEQVSSAEIPANIKNKKLKFALVYETATGTYASQYIAGFKKQCAELGIDAIVTDATGSQDKMISNLDSMINQRVDAIIISHGRADALKPGVEKALAAGIPVITKDVDVGIEGVPAVDQDDFLLGLSTAKAMAEDINGKGQVVRGFAAGFLPQERRSLMFTTLMTHKYPNIKEVAQFGPVSASTALDSQTKMEAILKQYPGKADLAAVWTGWEEWSKGASRAIMEAGRADDIKVYGIDISDETLQMLQDPKNPYTASAGLDPAMTAKVCVRMALAKLGGEFVPQYYSFDTTLVRKSDLPTDKKITMAELGQYVPGWGENNDFMLPWMAAMKALVK